MSENVIFEAPKNVPKNCQGPDPPLPSTSKCPWTLILNDPILTSRIDFCTHTHTLPPSLLPHLATPPLLCLFFSLCLLKEFIREMYDFYL